MIDTPDVLNDPAWAPVPPFETEVFQPGDYRGLSWTNEMTSQMVSNYNNLPEEVTWRAQTTVIDASEDKVGETDIGHDNRDLRNRQRPSLGVIEKLKESGDKVVATLRNVPRFMHDCIKRGIFPSVSLTVYRDGKDEFGLNGPVPRGLSYLGAEPPQLKKLRKALDILSEEGGDVTRIEGITFADETVAGVNPANNIKSNLISFSMKGNEMPENTVQPEAPPVTPPADEAPVDSDARLTALEEQMAAIVGLLEAMQPEAETVADEAGEVTTPQT